jgi:tetratricopeptide (TPR) repeat protein
VTSNTAARLIDQLDQIELDLADVEEQLSSGELDEATADGLRATYLAEAERIRGLIDDGEPEVPAPGRSRSRTIAGAVVLGLGVAVIAAAAVASLGDRTPGGNLTGGVATDVLTGEGVDLAAIGNDQLEAVVAANPDIVPMRMALARRYFEAGDFGDALPHYLYILDDLGRAEPEALANVGWMTALSGRPDVARDFVTRALEIDPEFPQAYWFLANIDSSLDDPCRAVEALTTLLGFDEIPDDIMAQAETLLDASEAACDE